MRPRGWPWYIFLAGLTAVAGCDDGTSSVGSHAAAPAAAAVPDAKVQLASPEEAPISPSAAVPDKAPAPQEDTLFAVLIGGFDSDPTPAQLGGSARRGTGRSGLYQLSQDLEGRGVATRFFNWDGSGPGEMGRQSPPGAAAIAKFLRDYHNEHPNVPLVVVGNSWGGQTALESVTLLSRGEKPTPIAQLVLCDASSFLRSLSGLPAVPKNVVAVTNYYSHNAITTGPLVGDERVENIDLGDPGNGFLREEWARYDSTNEWRAHILVEWDPLIHQDIERRIVELAAD
jgi:pimeloyl-ACP methyl ester carboxylesterase